MKGTIREEAFPTRENLSDAGCNREVIEEFAGCNRRQEQYKLLASHRRVLLDKLHRAQKEIDCLDYLVYTMHKEDKK